MKLIVLSLSVMTCFAQSYSATKTKVDSVDVVRLADTKRAMEVSIAPSVGNAAYEFNVKGKNLFWLPGGLDEFRKSRSLAANPFLAPWANRLDQDAFYANGKKYILNPELKNLRRDPSGLAIHGLLLWCPDWRVVKLSADDRGAEAVSRLEFWRYPELMAQFPFAHAIEMTYRLADGALEVRTRIENQSAEPMPLVIGYHPYFRLHDSARDQWKVHIAARDHIENSKKLVPTGERTRVNLPDPAPLATAQIDDVFDNLIRDADGRAEFWVQGEKQKISVIYGPKYNTAIVYAPPGKEFICIEPMTGITNGFNLAHAGLYKELQSIPAGGVWEESYWIRPSGF
jgi:aldose 1-epimerase